MWQYILLIFFDTTCLFPFNLSGRHLAMLPVEPKLGKMLILGAIFNCLDPILTIVAGLSVRDPFLTPFEKKEVRITILFFFSKIFVRNFRISEVMALCKVQVDPCYGFISSFPKSKLSIQTAQNDLHLKYTWRPKFFFFL